MLSKKIANASAITIFFTAVSMGLGVVAQALIGRTYGPEGLGIYASFMMFIGLYSMFAIFGIPASLSKYIAEYEEKSEFDKIQRSYSSVLIFVTFTSLTIGMISYYTTPYMANLMHIKAPFELVILISICLIFYVYSQIAQAYYRGLLNALKASLIETISLLAILCTTLYSYFFDKVPIFYILFFGYSISGIFGLVSCIKDKSISISFSREELGIIIKFALPIALISYFIYISQWMDRLTLGIYLGVYDIGIFTAGVTIVQATRQIPASLTNILIPSYSKISSHGKKSIEDALSINITFTSIFLFLIASITFIYAKDLVFLFYGTKFEQTIVIVKILSIGTFFTAVTIPFSTLITGSGHPKLNLFLNIINIPVQIVFIVLFTKYYGAIGTAIANSLINIIYAVGTVFMTSKVLKIHINWNILIKTIMCWIFFMVSYYITYNISHNSIVSGVFSIFIYILFCLKYLLNKINFKLIYST